MELKIIFNGLKRVFFDSILFRWKIRERYANFYNKNVVRLFFMLIGLFTFFNVQSQIIIEQGTVKANFGIDADIKSDITTFTTPVWPTPQNTDDWFKLNGGTGKGVIDITSASALSQIQSLEVNPNASAELRMAYPYFTVVDGRYWIDAVYLRDQQTSGNYKDSNVFAGQSNKNFDNPNTWNIGLGDVPQKNDIIDVYGHLRRDGTNILNNPEWGFVGLSTRNDNGDSYIDIEYFRKKIEVGGNGIVSPGADGGRTAWTFSNTGMTTQLGDIIISLDFSNGGVGITGKIYVWMLLNDKSTAYFDNFNTLPDRPFRFVKVGNSYVNYSGGSGAGGFGYARIELKNIGDASAIFSAVNIGSNVDAPSWGTINSSGNIAAVYNPIIFYEFGFNLTALGFDSSSTQVGCVSPFGSVIVKTRSSDSFTAELKDLAGPIELGADLEVDVSIDGNTTVGCTETSTILTATAMPVTNNFSYQWYFNGDLIQNVTSNTLVATQVGTYTVEATIVLGSIQGCTASNSVDVAITPPIPININCPENYQVPACSTQADINAQFETWYNSFTASGGTNLQIQVTITDQQGNPVVLGNPIVGPNRCGGIYTVLLQASDDCNQTAQCSAIFTVVPDETLPIIQDQEDVVLDGCNTPWPSEVTTTWSDNCSEGGTILGVAGTVMTGLDGCSQYIDYTFNVIDDCGNAAVPVVIRVSRMYDETLPIIQDQDDVVLDGCNTPWPIEVTTTWSDNCSEGGTISGVAGTVMTGLDGCSQYIDYTFNVTDDCGNSAVPVVIRVSRMYDETLPIIQDQEDVVLDGCNTPWPSEVTTTWSDNCSEGGTISGVAGTVMTGLDGCSQYIDYTFNVIDDCGNAAVPVVIRVSRMYDETLPIIQDQEDVVLDGCNAPWPSEVTTTWSDNCSEGGTISGVAGTVMTGLDGCSQYIDYTFNVIDDCGNAAVPVVIRVSRMYDETLPIIQDQDDVVLDGCNTPWPIEVTTTWSDNCSEDGTILGVAGTVMTGLDGCSQYIDYTFNVIDDCGNAAVPVVIRVSRMYDETLPIIQDQDDVVLDGCNTPWPIEVTTTWSDNCSEGGTISGVAGTVMTGLDGCSQYIDYTFNVTDDCGNSAVPVVIRVSRMYDETLPIIQDQEDVVLDGCNTPWPSEVTTTWSDNCSEGGTISGVAGTVMTGLDGCSQYIDYTFNVIDDCGNAAVPVVIRVSRMYDETLPIIQDQEDVVLDGCNAPWPSEVTTTWSDNCSEGGTILGVAGTVMTGLDGCSQYIDYTFNVTDDCGNAAVPVVIRVSRMYDETLPVIQDQDDVVLEGCNAPWPSEVTTTWSDNCSEGGTISGVAGTVMLGLDGCSQYIDYTFNITDDCGNAAVPVVIRVSRMYDETLPVIQDQEDVVLDGCNAPWPSEVTTTWSDNCSEGGTISGVAGTVMLGLDGCSQYIDYTFNVTDDCGNAAVPVVIRVSRMYDETLPVIQDQDDVVLDGCNTPWPSEVTTTWSDNCSEGGTISGVAGTVMLGLDGCSQYIDYTFNVTDDCGNAAVPVVIRVSRMYDETLPVIQDQDDVILDGCNAPWPSEVTTTWSDNCSEGGTISGVAGAVMLGLDGCSQYIDYTFNATDDCGNAAVPVVIRVSRMYDETLPVIQDQDDVVLDGCNTPWPSEVTTTWSDNCSEGGTISGVAGTVMLGLDGCSQYIDYTFNATDDCGNAAVPVVIRVSRMYDETPPEINCPSDMEVFDCNEVPYIEIPVATDNCDQDVTVTATRSDGLALNDPFPIGELVTITFTAEDNCYNEASCSFTVLVNSCDAPHCTYTQGFYGNVNGTACLPNGGSTMAQNIMVTALTNVGGEYNFGSLSTGNYFLLKLTDINRNHIPAQNNIFKMMPGGGTPRQLIGFATYDIFATWADNDPLNASGKKKGKINNNLLSQTITLFFNLQMDNGLGSYELTNTFATVDVECGTDIPIPDSTQIFNVSQNVIDYLEWNGGATVSNLFILANKALGGENIGSLSHSEIEQAVDAINKGFDTCRMQVPVPVEESVDLSDSLLKADFIVYPVPFKDYFTIQYQFRYQSDVEIQVFDVRGLLLMTAHDKGATYGKEIRVNTTFNLAGRDAFYYVKVISRTGVSIKKIVSVSR